MLVLARKKLESIAIDGRISVTIVECGPRGVRLGISAPREVAILRQELVLEQHNKGGEREDEAAELACATGWV